MDTFAKLDRMFDEVQHTVVKLTGDVQRLVAENTALRQERERISEALARYAIEHVRVADTLREFYQAQVSLSSLQPVLALCVELNPDLADTPHRHDAWHDAAFVNGPDTVQ